MNLKRCTIAASSLFALVMMFLISSSVAFAQETFKITISREYSGPDCTSGYLSVNGTVICYTLERPWENNTPLISAIPAGTYTAHLRYDHTDAWRIELDDVPDRPHVQIHIGNVVANSTGCILVGNKFKEGSVSELVDSAVAYNKLKAAFYGTDTPNSTPDKDIVVEITDVGPQAAQSTSATQSTQNASK